ncbi:MAG: hypothetical protein ABSE16_04220 [Verrucomicrobiota bacterium]
MNNNRYFFRLALASFLFAAAGAPAMVFTNNTAIGPLNLTYDGSPIVVSNCTLTVDGTHNFASLLIATGGTLTHSFWSNGVVSVTVNVTNEQQVLSGTNPATLLNTNVVTPLVVTDLGQTTTYSNEVDYVQTNLTNGLTQIQRTITSSIPDGVTVLVSYGWNYLTPAGMNLSVTGDVTVASGGSIDASGIGYAAASIQYLPGSGPGGGSSSGGTYYGGSGASHGGIGGLSLGGISSSNTYQGGVCYDSLYAPTNEGSGGGASYAGSGGNGGGAVEITASGSVDIEGAILVSGMDAPNDRAGGGAGGSVWITAGSVSGSGSIAANGGAGASNYGGGGGGGLIAIYCNTNNFAGSVTAYGGSGSQFGGAGTIFTQLTGQMGLLLMDNGGNEGTNSTITLPTTENVIIRGGAGVIAAAPFSPGNITIEANSALSGLAGSNLVFAVAGNMDVQPGGQASADNLGYAGGMGPGAGGYYISGSYAFCGGAGHGGFGGNSSVATGGGGTYDSQITPTALGSGGGTYSSSIGGAGGGAIQLTVAGNLQVDGRITANGGNGTGLAGGGGSGGAIILKAGTLAGSGAITASGGNGVTSAGGGGGGGRIAIICSSNTFSGNINAFGGGGANWGGAGTVYYDLYATNPAVLVLDNGGNSGAMTPLQVASPFYPNLTVQNGANGFANSSMHFGNLTIGSNAWLTVSSNASPFYTSVSLAVLGNAAIQAGGGITGDSQGYTSGQGQGPGGNASSAPYAGGGGGHGGYGGNAISNSAAGGGTYDLANGSGLRYYCGSGGGGYLPFSTGGSGGSAMELTVVGTLQLNGLITANGGNGSGSGGGGGSGGNIYLSAGTFSGAGAISANGGNGVPGFGGGGGGGRIAVYFNTDSFTGTATAYGGSGANYGGAGTIYFQTNSTGQSLLIVDNAGKAGASSSVQYSANTDLTLRNDAFIYANGSNSFGNLIVGSNAWVLVTNMSISIWANNVTVQRGGGIIADSAGNGANQGNGRGSYGYMSPFGGGSGGGHGGYGANCISNIAAGGTAYDSFSAPYAVGSGGGGYPPYESFGGSGGGLIQMNVSGNLQVDGTVSANGGNGWGVGGGGGGSGGGVNLSCATLAGAGIISANGGSSAYSLGGGGGGGMIAMSFTSNLYSGTVSACGGGGATYGGAGTIYFQTNSTGQSLVIVDNGGHVGTNTPIGWLGAYTTSLVLRNGAVAVSTSTGTTSFLTSLLIASNAWYIPGSIYPGTVELMVGNATIQAGGGIVTDASGSAQNTGAGPGIGGSGAGHGGYGALCSTNSSPGGITYDSSTAPSSLGSGGGGGFGNPGGAGGGYIYLVASGTLRLDGILSANGGNGSGNGGGGGSGGSIYLFAVSLAGAGSITANGGSGALGLGGGGGGGRIALYSMSPSTFTGAMSAYGGGGANYGGAGTIFYENNLQPPGSVVLDNANHAGTNTTFDFINENVTVQHGAIGLLPASGSWSPNNVLISSNSEMTAFVSTTNCTINASNVTIAAGGALSLDTAGYGPDSGPGAGGGILGANGGAGHGGCGGVPVGGGGAYDAIQSPNMPGSGGQPSRGGSPAQPVGGSGGGALALNVSGTLTVNGRLTANGTNGTFDTGGGAGGSICLTNIYNLAGNGVISANGGSGTGTAGGGGGGRLALVCTSNNFTGQLSAFGGNAMYPGGAGTIYTSVSGVETLRVDNGGIAGTNTLLGGSFPLPPSSFELDVAGGAFVVATPPLPLLSNLNVTAGSTITVPVPQTNLFITVLNNANIAGNLNLNNLGYPQANGFGAGGAIANKGSGGGYGGSGGESSSGAPGGTTYGSVAQPVDFGSGGGNGDPTTTGGSDGGGAIRLSVVGALTVNGEISANGNPGWQDDSGGGSGGSVWIDASSLAGAGGISATGGNGVLLGGGGGGGGRIAIYTLTNNFSGATNVNGGTGASPGQPGTAFVSTAFPGFQVVSQSPTGLVMNTVSTVNLGFDEALNPASVSASDFTLVTPVGPLPSSNLTAVVTGLATVQVSFPAQNLVGTYTVQTAATLTDVFGVPLTQPSAGTFTISLPTISGTVTSTKGNPVSGVWLQPSGGLTGLTTDTNGNYALGVPAGWSGSVTPTFGSFKFTPGSLAYTNVTASLTNQNYLMAAIVAPTLAPTLNGGALLVGWTGVSGVTYQPLWSTNLITWQPWGSPLAGTNGLMQIAVPLGQRTAFFQMNAM